MDEVFWLGIDAWYVALFEVYKLESWHLSNPLGCTVIPWGSSYVENCSTLGRLEVSLLVNDKQEGGREL